MFNTLRSKLYATFGLTMAVFAIVLASLGWLAHANDSKLQATYQHDIADAAQLAAAQNAIWALRWGVAQYIALGDADAAGRARIVEAEATHAQAMTDALDDLSASAVDGAEAKGIDDLRAAFKNYFDSRATWFKLVSEGKAQEAAEWRAKTTTPYGAATVKALSQQFDLQRVATREQVAKAQAAAARVRLIGLATLLLLVIPAVSIWWTTRQVSRRLDEAVDVAQAVADGNLGSRIEVRGADETGRLLAALKKMNENLHTIVRQVRAGSESITSGSAEIASGNADLSQRTEEQASSLQQTAASMSQLAGTVRNSADTARQAAALADSASQVAVKGGEVVGQVVSTMEEISSSSKKIGDIIGVIDSIAFQTNILALNAAVEAARAGEQGRGFSVVASEVRALAQRSAAAAKEIKTLIGASVEKVASGSQLVNDAGRTMGDIVQQVRRVTDLISEISSASSEQTSGIEQVSQAVHVLDQVTQQNASLVEQAAAASESLKSQAGQLAGVVATFRLAEDAAYAP
ncbi:Methyl-accepting chemotaxis protein IV [Gammaproteobacteria bacterium]|nr:Methyl-accepting chemotaxis protein IV [Gammaproteobacteria bacterium]